MKIPSTLHEENAEITAAKMIARAKESSSTTMGIEYRENGSVVGGVLRCTVKHGVLKSVTTWKLSNGWHSTNLTKKLAVALLAEHYEMTSN